MLTPRITGCCVASCRVAAVCCSGYMHEKRQYERAMAQAATGQAATPADKRGVSHTSRHATHTPESGALASLRTAPASLAGRCVRARLPL